MVAQTIPRTSAWLLHLDTLLMIRRGRRCKVSCGAMLFRPVLWLWLFSDDGPWPASPGDFQQDFLLAAIAQKHWDVSISGLYSHL